MTALDRHALDERWTQLQHGLNRLRPRLELCRLPQSVLVMADPLAGALVAGADWQHAPLVLFLMLGTALMHAGAAALNDWHDFKADRVERPDRPIPAGKVNRWAALVTGVVLLGIGWALASIPALATGQLAAALLCCVLLHEFFLKKAPIAKAVPAVARALAFALGMALLPVAEMPETTNLAVAGLGLRAFFASVLGVYALGAILLAYRAADEDRFAFTVAGAIVVGTAVATLTLTRLFFPEIGHPSAAIWIGVLLLAVGIPVAGAMWRPGEAASSRAGWVAALGSVLAEAAMVAFVRGPLVSLPAAFILLPVVYSRRWLLAPSGPTGRAESAAAQPQSTAKV